MKGDEQRSKSMMGNKNAKRVLSDDDRRMIRELYAEWQELTYRASLISPKSIAEKFDIHKSTFAKVVRVR